MPGRIYSVGYEGFDVATLIDHLASHQVSLVVDVRLNPISRKPGFSRKTLSSELQASGIDYRHEADLGNPPDNRDSFRRGDPEVGRRRMREDPEQRLRSCPSSGWWMTLTAARWPSSASSGVGANVVAT